MCITSLNARSFKYGYFLLDRAMQNKCGIQKQNKKNVLLFSPILRICYYSETKCGQVLLKQK